MFRNDTRERAKLLIRPTPWLLLLLACFWFMRALSLFSLRKWGHDFGLADAVAFLWDLLFVAGLAGLARGLGLGSAGRPLGAGRALRGYLLVVPLGLFVTAALFARAADVAYAALSGGHFSSAGFLYMKPENRALLRDGDGPLLLACLAVAIASGISALVFDRRAALLAARTHGPWSPRARRLTTGGACAALLFPLAYGFDALEEERHRFVPESLFVHEWLVWRGALDDDSSTFSLSPAMSAKLVRAGLLPDPPLRNDYPLFRAGHDDTPFPHPRAPNAEPRPNLVLTLVEQLNHEFIHAFSGEHQGVMPQLSQLSKRMTMVTEYQSTANPTIHALVASLCSLHCASHYRELNKGQGSEALTRTPLSCLPEILRQAGYRTVFVQGGHKEFAGKDGFLLTHGFEEMHGMPELAARFPGRPASTWGMHDDALVEYTQEQIRRLEAERKKDGRPYFLMMLTLDTHAPGLPPPTCAMPKHLQNHARDRDSRLMLRSLYCADAELGKLGRFLLGDPRRKQSTVWALTGDHPTAALPFVRAVHEKQGHEYTGWSGRLPLLLHDPTHLLPQQVPVLSSHIDLAPTLLHILGLPGRPNAMTGYSIFGKRPKMPMLVGRVGPKYVALYRPGRTRSMTLGWLTRSCAAREPVFSDDETALSSCELLAWVRLQDALWKHKRIVPGNVVARR